MSDFVVITVASDGAVPPDAKTSAGTVVTNAAHIRDRYWIANYVWCIFNHLFNVMDDTAQADMMFNNVYD